MMDDGKSSLENGRWKNVWWLIVEENDKGTVWKKLWVGNDNVGLIVGIQTNRQNRYRCTRQQAG